MMMMITMMRRYATQWIKRLTKGVMLISRLRDGKHCLIRYLMHEKMKMRSMMIAQSYMKCLL